MDAQTAAVEEILSFAIPEDKLPAHLETVAVMAESALKSYEKKVYGGESPPAIWENWDGFSDRTNDFAIKIEVTGKHAKEGCREAIIDKIVLALSCKSYHDIYREKNSRRSNHRRGGINAAIYPH
jgi:cytochrome c556